MDTLTELILRVQTSNVPIIMTALKLRLTIILVLILSTPLISQEFEQINLVHDGLNREYLVYVPNENDDSIRIHWYSIFMVLEEQHTIITNTLRI